LILKDFCLILKVIHPSGRANEKDRVPMLSRLAAYSIEKKKVNNNLIKENRLNHAKTAILLT